MKNTLVDFEEFQRRRDELLHKNHWEINYRNQTKELLLNQLLEQQELNFPLKNGDRKDQKQFNALVAVLEEKASTSWLKQILKTLHIRD